MSTIHSLYKDNLEWQAWVEGNLLFTRWGKIGGVYQESTKEIQGVNIGKANQTTDEEQALKRLDTLIRNKIDKGYQYEKTKGLDKPFAMLASSYNPDKVIYPCFCQPKLDGVRCLAQIKGGKVTLYSRNGKVLNFPHLEKELLDLNFEGIIDGELYDDLPFNELISKIKLNANTIKYYIYDYISDEVYSKRLELLTNIKINSNFLYLTPTYRVTSQQEMSDKEADFISRGYEGLMLRLDNEPYKQNKRAKSLMKVKRFMEDEFTIDDVVDGEGKFKGQAIFVCNKGLPTEFTVVLATTEAVRKKIFIEKESYIGKVLTVKHFSPSPIRENQVPRFPIGKSIRDYE